MNKPCVAAVSVLLCVCGLVMADNKPAKADPLAKLKTYNTPYYTLGTDVSETLAREADLRMTRMFEEYKRRTSAFSGDIRAKLPFLLFSNAADYKAAGGIGAGVYSSEGRLMATAQGDDDSTWHVVQHEGFHQFAAMTMGWGLPTWLNEGLAEYFGEGLFTGDTIITGNIPGYRLRMIQKDIAEKKWKFSEMMSMSPEAWSKNLKFSNYTQAWAMVHFLVHGENGKYQKPFEQYIMAMRKGSGPDAAWAAVFGKDVNGFQEKCEKWWSEQPAAGTPDVLAKATVATMTSLLARSELQKKKFASFDELLAATLPTDTKLSREQWLPEGLVEPAMKVAPKLGTWKLEPALKGQLPKLTCVVANVGTITGTFTLAGNRVEKVNVTLVKEGEPTTAPK